MAAREVATTWKGDPEYQSKAASLFHGTIKEVRGAAKGDPLIEQLYLESERLVIEAAQSSGGSADSVTWQQAQRSYDGGKYDDARKSYLTIGQAADEHEKALVKAALCLYKKNDRDGAKKEFLQYLEGFVPDPRNAGVMASRKGSATVAIKPAETAPGSQLAKTADRFNDPWLRGLTLVASVQDSMIVTRFGDPDYSRLAPFMHKPDMTVMMTFSHDPHLGMSDKAFTGASIIFQPTVTFVDRQTAALQ